MDTPRMSSHEAWATEVAVKSLNPPVTPNDKPVRFYPTHMYVLERELRKKQALERAAEEHAQIRAEGHVSLAADIAAAEQTKIKEAEEQQNKPPTEDIFARTHRLITYAGIKPVISACSRICSLMNDFVDPESAHVAALSAMGHTIGTGLITAKRKGKQKPGGTASTSISTDNPQPQAHGISQHDQGGPSSSASSTTAVDSEPAMPSAPGTYSSSATTAIATAEEFPASLDSEAHRQPPRTTANRASLIAQGTLTKATESVAFVVSAKGEVTVNKYPAGTSSLKQVLEEYPACPPNTPAVNSDGINTRTKKSVRVTASTKQLRVPLPVATKGGPRNTKPVSTTKPALVAGLRKSATTADFLQQLKEQPEDVLNAPVFNSDDDDTLPAVQVNTSTKPPQAPPKAAPKNKDRTAAKRTSTTNSAVVPPLKKSATAADFLKQVREHPEDVLNAATFDDDDDDEWEDSTSTSTSQNNNNLARNNRLPPNPNKLPANPNKLPPPPPPPPPPKKKNICTHHNLFCCKKPAGACKCPKKSCCGMSTCCKERVCDCQRAAIRNLGRRSRARAGGGGMDMDMWASGGIGAGAGVPGHLLPKYYDAFADVGSFPGPEEFGRRRVRRMVPVEDKNVTGTEVEVEGRRYRVEWVYPST